MNKLNLNFSDIARINRLESGCGIKGFGWVRHEENFVITWSLYGTEI